MATKKKAAKPTKAPSKKLAVKKPAPKAATKKPTRGEIADAGIKAMRAALKRPAPAPKPALPLELTIDLARRAPIHFMLLHSQLKPWPGNPRRMITRASVEQQAATIRAVGDLIEPIVARSRKSATDEIIAGERRWRAIGLLIEQGHWAKDRKIRTEMRDATDQEMLAMAAAENLGREDLHAIDEADLIRRLIDDNGMSKAAIARDFPRLPERTIYRRLELLKLSIEAGAALRGDLISLQQAEALAQGAPDRQDAHLAAMRRLPALSSLEAIGRAMANPVVEQAGAARERFSNALAPRPDAGAGASDQLPGEDEPTLPLGLPAPAPGDELGAELANARAPDEPPPCGAMDQHQLDDWCIVIKPLAGGVVFWQVERSDGHVHHGQVRLSDMGKPSAIYTEALVAAWTCAQRANRLAFPLPLPADQIEAAE